MMENVQSDYSVHNGWKADRTDVKESENNKVNAAIPTVTTTPSGEVETEAVTIPNHWLFGKVFLIEIVAFLYLFAATTVFPVLQYYIIHRVEKANPNCNNTEILAKVADYNIYFSLSNNLTAIIPTIFYGMMSDRYGRKVVILISIVGSLINYSLVSIIIHFNAQLHFFYIPFILDGLCGTFGTFIMGIFSAVADITTEGAQRNVRITVLMAVCALATATGSTSSGFWTQYVSYDAPMIMSASSILLSLLFLIFAIPETNKRGGQTQMSIREKYLGIIKIFTESDSLTRRILFMCLSISMAAIFNIHSNFGTQIMYLKGSPFQWRDDKIAIYRGVSTLCGWVLIVCLTKLFGSRIRDVTFAAIGAVSAVGGLFIQGLASNDAMMYAAAAIFLVNEYVSAMMRANMSRHAPSSHQGSLFSSNVPYTKIVNPIDASHGWNFEEYRIRKSN